MHFESIFASWSEANSDIPCSLFMLIIANPLIFCSLLAHAYAELQKKKHQMFEILVSVKAAWEEKPLLH